jgi:hypothetical protein
MTCRFQKLFPLPAKNWGPGGVFAWQGQYYNTFYAEELDDNNQPVVEYEVTGLHDLETLEEYDSSPAPRKGQLTRKTRKWMMNFCPAMSWRQILIWMAMWMPFTST